MALSSGYDVQNAARQAECQVQNAGALSESDVQKILARLSADRTFEKHSKREGVRGAVLCAGHRPLVRAAGWTLTRLIRPLPEFREMFFEIWAARARTKLRKIWAQRGLDRRSTLSSERLRAFRAP